MKKLLKKVINEEFKKVLAHTHHDDKPNKKENYKRVLNSINAIEDDIRVDIASMLDE